jgi:tetratricopeptide (TPR) repeat protein
MLAFCCLAAGQSHPAAGQDTHSAHSMTMRSEPPPEQLPPPRKLGGIGNASLTITATPEAQRWFNQGLNLFHDFWDYESARAFEQSIRADPQCAMCYWGLYEAESNYHSTIKDYSAAALATAARLESRAGEAERLYIEASVAHESAMKSMQRGTSQEVSILRQLVAKYPSDTQAQIFLANALPDGYDMKGEPNPGQRESLALLQEVIKRDPKNSAANHYWIHALEGLHPEQALASAKLVAILAPSSGHMVHMPGHIFYRLGEYAEAEKSFAASMEVDERYMRQQHVSVDDDWNYVHNLMYAVANLLEEGKIKAAEQLSGKLANARGELPSTMYVFSARDSIARLNSKLPVALRIAAWPEVLELLNAAGDPEQPNLRFLKRSLVAIATGMQAVEKRDLDNADEAIRSLDAELWEASEAIKVTLNAPRAGASGQNAEPPKLEVLQDALAQPLISFLSIMSLEMRGSVLVLKGKLQEGKQLFESANQEERRLGYREPPHYIRPVGEAEGAALVAVRDWAGATAAYKDALAERPHSGFPLFGLAMSSEGSGDVPAAVAAYGEFLLAWKDGDAGSSARLHAQAYLAEHQGH